MTNIDLYAGQDVGDWVFPTEDVPDSASELGDGREVSLLLGRPCITWLREGVDEGQMVGVDGEWGSLQEVPEVVDEAVDGQEFPVKGAISCLIRLAFPVLESRQPGAPLAICLSMVPAAMLLASVLRDIMT